MILPPNDPRALSPDSPNVSPINFKALMDWGTEDAKAIDRAAEVIDYWGPPCEDFDPRCACCQAWKLFIDSGDKKVPTDAEVDAAVDAAYEIETVFHLVMEHKDGSRYPVEISATSLSVAIEFIESRDGSKFAHEIEFS